MRNSRYRKALIELLQKNGVSTVYLKGLIECHSKKTGYAGRSNAYVLSDFFLKTHPANWIDGAFDWSSVDPRPSVRDNHRWWSNISGDWARTLQSIQENDKRKPLPF